LPALKIVARGVDKEDKAAAQRETGLPGIA
jgi:hypothetical protein